MRRPRGLIVSAIALGVAMVEARTDFAAEHAFTLTAERKQVAIGSGLTYNAWTYDGTVPGPVLQVRQGDDVSIQLINHTTEAHGIEIEAAAIAPGHFSGNPPATVNYRFKAAVPGVFDYHCSAIPVLDHVASGMYGMMIVEPHAGWPHGKAREITLIQGEYDYRTANQNGLVAADHSRMLATQPDFVVFNGALGRYSKSSPIALKVNEPVRLFLLNAGPNLSSMFHVSGVIFSTVYLEGNPANILHNVSNLLLGPGQGAVAEFTVTEPGDYQFVDAAGAHSYKGALGVFHAGP